jgi:hypothetical protein
MDLEEQTITGNRTRLSPGLDARKIDFQASTGLSRRKSSVYECFSWPGVGTAELRLHSGAGRWAERGRKPFEMRTKKTLEIGDREDCPN